MQPFCIKIRNYSKSECGDHPTTSIFTPNFSHYQTHCSLPSQNLGNTRCLLHLQHINAAELAVQAWHEYICLWPLLNQWNCREWQDKPQKFNVHIASPLTNINCCHSNHGDTNISITGPWPFSTWLDKQLAKGFSKQWWRCTMSTVQGPMSLLQWKQIQYTMPDQMTYPIPPQTKKESNIKERLYEQQV